MRGACETQMIKTLIVDDSEVFRLSLRRMLAARFAHMRIAEAATLRDAVLQAHAVRADIVFIDVRLPDGNGLDLPRFIAPTLPQARVCIVTSYDLPEYRAAAREAGACHFLAKSNSTSAEVVSVVNAALSYRVPSLLIDPSARRRSRIAKMLGMHWPVLMVFEARDMASAVEVARAHEPEIVFVRTASLTAADPSALSAIRSIHRDTRVIALHDEPAPRGRMEALHAGADHAVRSRAATLEDLAPVMQALLSARPKACELEREA